MDFQVKLLCSGSHDGIEALSFFTALGEEHKFLKSHSWKTKQLYFYNACFKNCCFPKISMRFAVNRTVLCSSVLQRTAEYHLVLKSKVE